MIDITLSIKSHVTVGWSTQIAHKKLASVSPALPNILFKTQHCIVLTMIGMNVLWIKIDGIGHKRIEVCSLCEREPQNVKFGVELLLVGLLVYITTKSK